MNLMYQNPDSSGESSINVLYFEDNPADGLLLQNALETDPLIEANVTIVGRLTDGIAMLRKTSFDIALLDLNLPDSQGMDSFRKLRDTFPDLPFIVLTGLDIDEDAAKILREGAQDYVVKGNAAQQVISRSIRFSIERHRVRLELERRTRQLAESEARAQSRSIIESSADAAVVVDLDGIIRFVNPAAELLFGRSRDNLVSRDFGYTLVENHPTELEIRRDDGAVIIVEMRVAGIVWDRKNAFLASLRDITQHKRIQQELKQTLDRLEIVVSNAPVLLWSLDARGIMMFAGGKFLEHLGVDPDDLAGQSVFDVFRSDHDVVEATEIALRGRSVHVKGKIHNLVVELWYSPTRDSFGNFSGTIGVAIDVTGQTRLEEQFRQAQKMEAVGRLAGGVAHDFNNLLTIIVGYSDMLLEEKTDPAIYEMLSEVREAGSRAAALTRQLLAFSRQSVFQPKLLDINTVIVDSEKLIRRLVGEDVQFSTVLANNLGLVKVDPSALDQAILNLVVNARDAMPQGGRLTIETANVDLDESYVATTPKAKLGPHVRISVSDTGTGIPPELQSQIFDPFFTTKEAGRGTGLGLSIVHGIVEQIGGHINVYSEMGIGTVFKIYLPRVISEASPARRERSKAVPLQGSETILFVEDDPAVRKFGETILGNAGFKVLSAENGLDAVEIAKNFPGVIDILVTDVVMPGLGGRQVAETLGSKFPHMKVLYVSGYTDDAILRHGVLRAEVAFLNKPYSPTTLITKIRSILDGTSQALNNDSPL